MKAAEATEKVASPPPMEVGYSKMKNIGADVLYFNKCVLQPGDIGLVHVTELVFNTHRLEKVK